ncbi:hypothetical protein D3C78_1112270 [compost metagenome]
MALEGAAGQLLAARAFSVAPGVVVVLQVRGELAGEGAFQRQARLFEVVVAAGHPAGAGFQAHGEALDRRAIGDQAGVLLVAHRGQLGEYRLVVAEHQHMSGRRVPEVVVDALLLAQALDEVQVGLAVLHAVGAFGVDGRAELEAIAVAVEDAVLLQYPADDLRHAEVLEDALVAAVGQVGEAWHQAQAIAGQALAGVALGNAVDQTMHPATVRGEGEKGRLVQQTFQVEVGAFADQFEVEAKRLADGLAATEGEDLQVVAGAIDVQGEVGGIGRSEHPLFLVGSSMGRPPFLRHLPRRGREAFGISGRARPGKRHRPEDLADAWTAECERIRRRSACASRRSRRYRRPRGSRRSCGR